MLFNLDSGDDITVFPYDTFLKLESRTKLRNSKCAYKMDDKGVFTAHLTRNFNFLKGNIYVVESLTQAHLGRDAPENLKVISTVCELTSDEYKASTMPNYPNLFTGLGMMEEENSIKLKGETNHLPPYAN